MTAVCVAMGERVASYLRVLAAGDASLAHPHGPTRVSRHVFTSSCRPTARRESTVLQLPANMRTRKGGVHQADQVAMQLPANMWLYHLVCHDGRRGRPSRPATTRIYMDSIEHLPAKVPHDMRAVTSFVATTRIYMDVSMAQASERGLRRPEAD